MLVLIDLFLTFAKIGLFTFGGGYAMISLIENDCDKRKHTGTDHGKYGNICGKRKGRNSGGDDSHDSGSLSCISYNPADHGPAKKGFAE